MSGRKPAGNRPAYALLALTLLLSIAALFLYMKARDTQKTYEAELKITAVPAPTPPLLYARPTEALLRAGSVGPEVIELQERLQALKYYTSTIDGQYGNGTKAAVQRFQEQHGLNPDGMAGTETLRLLYSEQAQALLVTPAPQLPSREGGLPLLVNRSHALPEGYAPKDLVKLSALVPDKLLILKDPDVRASRPAVEALIAMIKAAKADGLDVWQVSEGYRSTARQQELFDAQLKTYMEEEDLSEKQALTATEKTVARPGTSEHHTGLAFDLTVPNRYFGDTPQALWLEDHCWDYGFIMRYTSNKEDITGYLPEPWHVRYVGKEHARFMQQHNLALEEYLALYP